MISKLFVFILSWCSSKSDKRWSHPFIKIFEFLKYLTSCLFESFQIIDALHNFFAPSTHFTVFLEGTKKTRIGIALNLKMVF